VVTHQLQVERRTAKARRPKTDVLPLDHATKVGGWVFLLDASTSSTVCFSSSCLVCLLCLGTDRCTCDFKLPAKKPLTVSHCWRYSQFCISDDGFVVISFRVSRRPREMYCGHACLCVCLSVCLSVAACPHYCMDPDVTWGSGRGCPLVVHYWADLQSVHRMCCYSSIMEMRGRAQR